MWMRQHQKSRAGAEPANRSPPMRYWGLWSKPMGEGVGDSVLGTKVGTRENSARQLRLCHLLCDPSIVQNLCWETMPGNDKILALSVEVKINS